VLIWLKGTKATIEMQPETLLAQLALRAHLAERNEGDY